ncbi:Uncharacterised protein [Candidatus Tiddalikarchaeum anstoanum]|nr:Uncharacterised protein [Candidatus Tiddalikarchaeum anstoanum]
MFRTHCEKALWKTLPSIRRELVSYLVKDKGIERKKVARIMGLTEPALCQYLKNKRGSVRFSKEQKKAIMKVGEELSKEKIGKNVFMNRICDLCKIMRMGC